MFSVAYLHAVELFVDLAVGVALDQLQAVLDQVGFERVGDWYLGDGLAVVLIERRLGVEGLCLADSTGHEQPDNALCFRSEMRFAIRGRPLAGFSPQETVTLEHSGEGDAGEAASKVRKKSAAWLWYVLHLKALLSNGYKVVVIQ